MCPIYRLVVPPLQATFMQIPMRMRPHVFMYIMRVCLVGLSSQRTNPVWTYSKFCRWAVSPLQAIYAGTDEDATTCIKVYHEGFLNWIILSMCQPLVDILQLFPRGKRRQIWYFKFFNAWNLCYICHSYLCIIICLCVHYNCYTHSPIYMPRDGLTPLRGDYRSSYKHSNHRGSKLNYRDFPLSKPDNIAPQLGYPPLEMTSSKTLF